MTNKFIGSRLRYRISLQALTSESDGSGGVIREWENVADLWANIEPLSSKEQLRGQQLQASCTHRFTIRYRSDVTAAQRILYNGRIFNIRGVLNPLHKGELIEILAEEGAG